ncbi:MAG: metallophosphoesterase [Candidatus Dormibacteraeota bacterium]|uniref:Metallophosphoesterase n=1 Tax=Candidatus Aeolococcus gillhamiae TaxID=3127015 RepID=A0A934K3E7_9BACT|nr:metallophosphoesterase [Candidatus Dormibacteraeota bacterium]
MSRPLLIVGDVQGDVERLEDALQPYPEDDVDTMFLGDFFQGGRPGRGGGAAAARLARSRRNSRSVLGNHDLFLLAVLERRRGVEPPEPWRLRDPAELEALWLHRRGDWADLEEVSADPDLEAWLRNQPFLILLADGTLVQHTDDDLYADFGATVDDVNDTARAWLATPGGVFTAVRTLFGRRAFLERRRLDVYLEHFGARRLVHGHTPHWEDAPSVDHDGRLWGFDGRFSRYWNREEGELFGPISATVGLLPALER